MITEYHSLIKNETWKLVDRPAHCKPIECKWIFKRKRNENGGVESYKSRQVAKGCSQKYGRDYEETFARVVRKSTIILILALSVEYDIMVHQMDVKSAYLNGNLKVYMEQPECFTKDVNNICKLSKSFYRLKHSGREWNVMLNEVLVNKLKFEKNAYDRLHGNRKSNQLLP